MASLFSSSPLADLLCFVSAIITGSAPLIEIYALSHTIKKKYEAVDS